MPAGGVDVEAVIAHESFEIETWLLHKGTKLTGRGSFPFTGVEAFETLFDMYRALIVPLSSVPYV